MCCETQRNTRCPRDCLCAPLHPHGAAATAGKVATSHCKELSLSKGIPPFPWLLPHFPHAMKAHSWEMYGEVHVILTVYYTHLFFHQEKSSPSALLEQGLPGCPAQLFPSGLSLFSAQAADG